jgi:hypothetical protein
MHGLHIPHQRPDAILRLNVVKAAQLSRHGQSQMQKTTRFRGPRYGETSAEWRHVKQPRQLYPLVIQSLAAMHAYGQVKLQPLAFTTRFSIKGHRGFPCVSAPAPVCNILGFENGPPGSPKMALKPLILWDF